MILHPSTHPRLNQLPVRSQGVAASLGPYLDFGELGSAKAIGHFRGGKKGGKDGCGIELRDVEAFRAPRGAGERFCERRAEVLGMASGGDGMSLFRYTARPPYFHLVLSVIRSCCTGKRTNEKM